MRFHPDGKRGWAAPAPPSSAYGARAPQFLPFANRETLIVATPGSVEGIEALPEMLQVDGIDVYDVGAGDLAQDMGHPGIADHPDVKAVADKGGEIIRAAGKVAGFNSGAGTVAEHVKKGVLYHCAGVAAFLIAGVQQFLRAARG